MPQKRIEDEELIGPSEASHILRCSAKTVRRYAKEGILPVVPVTGLGNAFRKSVVEALADSRGRKAPKVGRPPRQARLPIGGE